MLTGGARNEVSIFPGADPPKRVLLIPAIAFRPVAMNPWTFDERDRVMVLAVHPDDETLATGGLLQQARAGGAAIRVIYVTSGENNPWPQRIIERRWRIAASDRARFGRFRQSEAFAALETLGITAGNVVFLGFPDQNITRLLLKNSEDIVACLAREITQWQPSLLIGPSCLDLHPDHSATGLLLHFALSRLPQCQLPNARLEYLVHTRLLGQWSLDFLSLPLSPEQQAIKRQAILCHASQLKLRPRSLLAMAKSSEEFFAVTERPDSICNYHPVRKASIQNSHLRLELCMHPCVGAFGPSKLYFVSWNHCMAGVKLMISLPSAKSLLWEISTVIQIFESVGCSIVAKGHYRGNRKCGELLIPLSALGPVEQLFVKLERRFGFFDEAGWRALPFGVEEPRP
jgi:LmbE family N-acetylglucosaminyl deacetylase